LAGRRTGLKVRYANGGKEKEIHGRFHNRLEEAIGVFLIPTCAGRRRPLHKGADRFSGKVVPHNGRG
jgi:hypothetical protein